MNTLLFLSAVVLAQSPPTGEAQAKLMLEQVNRIRKENQVPEMKSSGKLATIALNQAQSMATTGTLTHFDAEGRSIGDRARLVGYKFSLVGENIALGPTTVESVMTAWLKSPGHRKNILEKGFREFGSASVVDSQGQVYWVQVFGTPK